MLVNKNEMAEGVVQSHGCDLWIQFLSCTLTIWKKKGKKKDSGWTKKKEKIRKKEKKRKRKVSAAGLKKIETSGLILILLPRSAVSQLESPKIRISANLMYFRNVLQRIFKPRNCERVGRDE